MIKTYLYHLLFRVLLIGCEKQTLERKPTLEEYIIGDWEVRESIDFLNFRDYEYHDIGPPYIGVYRFKEDQTYEVLIRGNPGISFPFSVNEQDSILMFGSGQRKLFSFNETFIDMRYNDGHGLAGHRIFKLE